MRQKLFIIWLMLLAGASGLRAAEAYTYFDPSDGSLNFCYDNYKSNRGSQGFTTYDLNTGSNNPGWHNDRTSVKKVVISSSFANARPTSCRSWFSGMWNLTSITGLEYLNTSQVTDMVAMFLECPLESIDVSHFDTSNVEAMGGMFEDCENLKSLDLSSFNTSNVNDKLLGFISMFYGCSSLTSLDLSTFTFSSSNPNSGRMFNDCSALKQLIVPATASRLNSNACSGVGTQSAPCALIYPVGFNLQKTAEGDGWYQWKSGYFSDAEAYAFLSSDKKTLTFYYDNYRSTRTGGTTYDMNTGSMRPRWCDNSSSITSVVFNSSFTGARPTSCCQWFYGMTKLESIEGIENLNTSEVRNTGAMFYQCQKLSNIDVSHFNTSKVENMSAMFVGCSFTTIDVSNFDTSNVSNMNSMFASCAKLESLDISNFVIPSFSSNNGEGTTNMFRYCNHLKTLVIPSTANNIKNGACEYVGSSSAPCILIYPEGFTPVKYYSCDAYYIWKSGYFKDAVLEPYAVLSTDKKTLTFYYDKKRDTRTETTFDLNEGDEEPEWRNNVSSIESVVFDSSFANARPTSCYMWFKGMNNLTSIMGISNLKTEEVTNMRYMFLDCYELKNVDVSGFNTSKVTDMGCMFYSCRSLESIDVSGFDTGNVTNIGYMFINCYYLESIDLSGFNTEKVTNMGGMFSSCIRLKNLDVSGFNTSNVTSMATMFTNCPVLESLDVSGFNTENVTDMTSMFAYCRSLQSLDVSGFDTEKVEEMESMFAGCTGLTSLDVSNFTFKSNTNTYSFLYGCSNLQKLVIPATASYWNNRFSYYEGACKGVGTQSAPCTLIYPSGFTPEKTSEGDGWYMWKDGYFKDAEPEPYAVLSTDKKTLTFYYDNHKGLLTGTTYDLNTGSERPGWFDYNSPVTNVVFDSSFADARPTSCKYWFYQMTNLTSITGIEYLNTSNVTNMASMFAVCKRLSNIDVSHFNTAQVKDMSAMFEQCSFTSIDVSNFDTSNVTNMVGMFYNNKSLETLDISNFVIPDSTNFYGNGTQLVFVDCQNLKTLILPSTAYNFKYGTCTRVGTQSAPCTLIYPADFTPEKTSEGDGWYMWKGGYFKDKVQFPLGDVNHDGYITVVDASLTVDYVMGNNPPVFFIENADMNSDGSVSITDVSKIVDMVMNGSASHAPATSREATMDRLWLTVNGGHCLLHLDTPERYTAMHITLRLPEGASMGNVSISSTRSAGHQVETRALADGLYNVVLYANNNSELRSDDTALLHFDIAGCQPRDVEVVAIQSTNRLFETIMSSGTTTGIDIVETDDATDGDSYNTVGVRVGKNARGVVIKNGRKKIEN